jgi:hypothetical protein
MMWDPPTVNQHMIFFSERGIAPPKLGVYDYDIGFTTFFRACFPAGIPTRVLGGSIGTRSVKSA